MHLKLPSMTGGWFPDSPGGRVLPIDCSPAPRVRCTSSCVKVLCHGFHLFAKILYSYCTYGAHAGMHPSITTGCRAPAKMHQ